MFWETHTHPDPNALHLAGAQRAALEDGALPHLGRSGGWLRAGRGQRRLAAGALACEQVSLSKQGPPPSPNKEKKKSRKCVLLVSFLASLETGTLKKVQK